VLYNIIAMSSTFEEASTVFDDDRAVYFFDETHSWDEEGINYDDIPEITDFSKGVRKPEIAARRKNSYTIIIEREGNNEVRKYDFSKIPYEVTIEKRAL